MLQLFFGPLLALSGIANAFPWVPDLPGVDSTPLRRAGYHSAKQKRDDPTCPFNTEHTGAAPFNPLYPYAGATAGLPRTLPGGYRVPAEGDTAHYYTPPTENDIRGPCPGMNTAANHNFLSHDGITTFAELVDAQQNLYGLGYDLAVFIATRGVSLDGDPVTLKMSIGCDATSRTSPIGGATGPEPGLNSHNRFEADTSLTRTDFFLGNGDNFSFNSSLWAHMKETADSVSGGLFDRETIAQYRSLRYEESKATNPNFYFGPKSMLLYGAASFVYEVMPVLGPEGPADLSTISTFFGAVEDSSSPSGWSHISERIPENWSNRVDAYDLMKIAEEVRFQYSSFPKLFGGNVGNNNFLALNTTYGIIENGQLPDEVTQKDIYCLFYQIATDNVPGSVSNEPELGLDALNWVFTQLNPIFANQGCPVDVNPGRK